MTDLARQLTESERDQSFPNRRPKDAATLILIDRTGDVPKILMGRRHHGHTFMPGKFVFPGGRVDPHDRMMPVAAPLHAEAEAKLMRHVGFSSLVRARALALAAIRETFEETGLLLGIKRDDLPPPPQGSWREFARAGFFPDLSILHFIARAITPPRRPKRFDTRFFCADANAIAHRVDHVVHADAELVELVWLPISEAHKLDMPTITAVILRELEARVAAGLAHDLPVPFYRMIHRRFRRESL